jgi:hypothetical protein
MHTNRGSHFQTNAPRIPFCSFSKVKSLSPAKCMIRRAFDFHRSRKVANLLLKLSNQEYSPIPSRSQWRLGVPTGRTSLRRRHRDTMVAPSTTRNLQCRELFLHESDIATALCVAVNHMKSFNEIVQRELPRYTLLEIAQWRNCDQKSHNAVRVT